MDQDPPKDKPKQDQTSSLESATSEIDEIILKEDPSFQDEINSLGENLSGAEVVDLAAEDSELDIDSVESEEGPSSERELKDDAPNYIRKFRDKVVLPFKDKKQKLILRAQNFSQYLRITFFQGIEKTKFFIIHSLPDYSRYLKSQMKAVLTKVSLVYKRFMTLQRGQRFALVFGVLLICSALFFASLTFKGRWMSRLFPNLPKSLAVIGQPIGSATNVDDAMPMSKAFPDFEYQVKIQKVIVNLRRDADSGTLPMGVFEFFLGLDNQDTAIEVRDREKEVLDRIQRELEQMTYTEVMSPTGKLKMKARIRESINIMLNQGRVVGVYINTMVTNH